MQKQLVVRVSCLNVFPTLLFVACCALCIVGNLVYIMTSTESNTGYKIAWWLWGAQGCSAVTGACTTYGTSDYDQVLAPTSDCTSWLRQLRAAEAFGVISSLVAGVAAIGSGALLVYQHLLTLPRVAIVGQLLCAAVMCTSVIAFILTVTLYGQPCITAIQTTNTTYDAAPWLYVVSFFLACVSWFLYRSIGKREDASLQRRVVSAPEARPYHHGSRAVGEQSADDNMVNTTERNVNAAIAPQQLPPSTPQDHNDGDDIELHILPEGDDWETDEESGLLWSEERRLFFDQASGHFYDPGSEQWYDPDSGGWYTINQDGMIIASS
jgi:hypothetical protein